MAAASAQASAKVQTGAIPAEVLATPIAKISRQVTNSADVARQATEDAWATDRALQSLLEAARSIGEVVRLISDIVGRTNMLALKATIEASRTGGAGHGFAVVASEVKALVAQTAMATDEIATQIASRQDQTKRAVGAIGGILRSIEKMNGITTQVAAATEKQTAATREIRRAVAEAAAGTQDVSRHTLGEVARHSETLRSKVDAFLAGILAA